MLYSRVRFASSSLLKTAVATGSRRCATTQYRFYTNTRNKSSFNYCVQPARMASTLKASGGAQRDFSRQSLFDLSGKVALITGGGSGIGLMAAQALAVNGARVYITGRIKEKLDTVVATYGKDISGEIIGVPADISHKAGVRKLYEEISAREKCICILVNNAGISGATFQTESESADEMRRNLFDPEEATFEDWNETYNTNVTGAYFVTTAFLPLLQKSSETHPGWSSTVINITSISGMIKTAQHHFAYNASKGAAIHLTRMLAGEISANGLKIRVNSLAPGVFPSEMTTSGSDEQQKSYIPKEKYAEKVPARRPGKDGDMAGAILFFATNQYLNGQNVAVDGGYTLAAGM